MKYFFYKSNCHNPYRNLAIEETLLNSVSEETSIIFLWQNERTVVIGRNQDINAEVNLAALLEDKGSPARRRSGGGAVYHDLGNLCYSILTTEKNKEYCLYSDLMIALLKTYGKSASYNGRNDVLLDNQKFSGNAEYIDHGKVCQHGTILINTDVSCMGEYLTPSDEKLERNHVASVRSRVVNLSDVMDISVEDAGQRIIEILDASQLPDEPDDQRVDQLEKIYSDKAWIYEGTR